MPATSNRPDAVELYLTHLNAALLDLPQAAREDFLREIRVHIFERLEQPDVQVGSVLQALGDPEELARQFHAECSIARAAKSWSPWTLMRTAACWGLTGLQGFLMFMVGFTGYLLAACFYITALLKPLFPDNVGFFISAQGLNMANWPAPRGEEVLAPYFSFIAIVVGFLCVAVTSAILRRMMRKFAWVRARARLAGVH